MFTGPMSYGFNIANSTLATFMRGGMGVAAVPAKKPPLMFELYEFEGCPYCRLVREALTELDLDALIFPCPKGGARYRPTVVERGGKAQFPYFVDPNTGREMFESADIVRYLFETYTDGGLPWRWQFVEAQKFGSAMAGAVRFGAGVRARASQAPAQPLELYSFESSPFARPVRELLCELELPYILRSVGRTNSSDWVPPAVREQLGVRPRPTTINRKALLTQTGRMTVPYLNDPNTGTAMGESADILRYLHNTYGV